MPLVIAALNDIRDDVGVAKHMITCVYLACQAPTLPANERAALCVVSNAAREKLESVEGALDRMIAKEHDD